VKATAPGGGQPPLAVKSAVPASSRAPDAAKAAATGGPKSAKAAPSSGGLPEAAKAARGLPPPGKRVADFATDISVEDYLVGKSLARVFFLFVDASQGWTKTRFLLFRLPRRPRRLPWCQGRRAVHFVPVARYRRSLPSGMRQVPCPAGWRR
jgi:hypothetical protein